MARLIFLFFAIFNYTISEAQNSVSTQTSISQNLLLHFNKEIYHAGDSLKFTCFVINRLDHLQDDNNLYVILTGQNGQLITKDKFTILNSSSHGTMHIPKDLLPGVYNIETFTPYMLNNGMIKTNRIIVSNTQADRSGVSEIVCKIFYDNNKLVSKIPNTFFIETAYANNAPASCQVSIIDNQNNEQGQLFTDVNGIGKITFIPLKNRIYNLNIKSNGKVYKLPLLQPDSIGMNMLVSFDSNIVRYKINKNFPVKSNQDFFTVTAMQHNEVVYTSKFSFDDYNIVTGGFNVAGLKTGLIKLSLVNNDDVAVSSTQIYVQHDNDFEPVILTSAANAANNKSYVDLSLTGKATSFFSIAVEHAISADSLSFDDVDLFYTNLLNEPQQKAVVDFYQVYAPGQTIVKTKYKILTPNKRTFKNELISKLDDEYATVIRGKVYDDKNEKLFTKGSLNFSYYEKNKPLNFVVPVKSDGSFILDSLIFMGKRKFFYRYYDGNNNEQSCSIKLIEDPNNRLLDSFLVNQYNYKPEVKNIIVADTNNKAKLLPEVKTKTEAKSKKQNVNDLYTTGIYSGAASAFIDNINNPPGDGSIPGGDFIKNRILNITFQNGNLVNSKNFSLGTRQFWIIGILIDESPASIYELNMLNARNIALVKFFDVGHVAAGSNNPGGLVAVYTRGGKANKSPDDMNAGSSGKEKSQVFEYDGFSSNNNNDTGQTGMGSVYWNPSVILPKDKNTYSFETEQLKPGKAYKVKIKGYNALGQIINFEKMIKN